MSLDRFKQIMDPHASRDDRIGVLASETDIPSGIIDGTTDVDNGYFQNNGPSNDTGTVYAALCDIMDFIHGRVLGSVVSIGGQINFDSSRRIALFGSHDADPLCELTVDGYSIFKQSVDFEGDVLVTGDFETADCLLNRGSGDTTTFGYTDIDYTDRVAPSHLGSDMDLLDFDSLGNLQIHLHGSGADRTSVITGAGGSALDDSQTVFNFQITSEIQSDDPIFSLNYNGCLVLGPKPMGIGDDFDESPGLTLHRNSLGSGPSAILMESHQNAGGQYIKMFGALDAATKSCWIFQHDWSTGCPGDLEFMVSEDGALFDTVLTMNKDRVRVVTDVGSADGYFELYMDTARWLQLHSILEGVSNRSVAPASSMSPGMLMTSGRTGFEARLAFDAWHEWNSVRLFVHDYSGVGCIPTVALGEPLGTNAAPIDALVVMKDPYGVGIGMDHRMLYASHSTKDGLHVGPADGDNGMVWLWGTSGHWPAIHLGANDSSRPILYGDDNGVMMVAPGNTSPSSIGPTFDGDHCVPVHTTLEDITTAPGRSGVATELSLSLGQNFKGSTALVTNGTNTQLWVSDAASGGNWWYFSAAGSETMV